tara:strand:- start:108 stop:503 length:396 start_codon:yes stop_codon:yes gene_type:complete
MKNYTNFSVKKCKSFGYTFSFIFLIVSIYDFLNSKNFFFFFLILSSIFGLLSLIKPKSLSFIAFYWEKFGIYLGLLFSPLILTLVYFVTIIPINIIIRLLNIDLIQKNKSIIKDTYWEENKKKKINFKDQY